MGPLVETCRCWVGLLHSGAVAEGWGAGRWGLDSRRPGPLPGGLLKAPRSGGSGPMCEEATGRRRPRERRRSGAGAWGHRAWGHGSLEPREPGGTGPGHAAPAALWPARTGEPSRGACPLRSAGARGRPGPGPYLEVGGALEGLPAHGAHVDALPPVRLLAVLQQQRRGREAAATLRALLQPALLLGLAARRQARRDVGHLQRVRMPGLTRLGQCATAGQHTEAGTLGPRGVARRLGEGQRVAPHGACALWCLRTGRARVRGPNAVAVGAAAVRASVVRTLVCTGRGATARPLAPRSPRGTAWPRRDVPAVPGR